jgi:cysteine desulfurase
VLHPIREIGALCRSKKVLFHTDATQAFGKEPIDVNADAVDLLSLSAHKIHGPKGVGALYLRRKEPRVRLEPLLHGGGHEKGLRSGTLNVPAIVGLGKAAELCKGESWERVRALRDRLEARLRLPVNGHPTRRLATTSNLVFPVDGEALMKEMPEVAVSSASACTSAQMQPSYVLGAMGADDARIRKSIRFSLGRFTTEAEIDEAVGRVEGAVRGVLEREGAKKFESPQPPPPRVQ